MPLAAAAAPAQAATAAYDINTHTKEHLTIGTIGHVDHGKTTLTAAISKVECCLAILLKSRNPCMGSG